MTFNYLLIIILLLALVCMIHGASKGILSIIYGMLSWIFVFWFISFASPFVSDTLVNQTDISATIQERIEENLHNKYENSEEKESGTGTEAVLNLIPATIKEAVNDSVQSSIDAMITALAVELTAAAIKGISSILTVIIACILVWLVGRLVFLIGKAPGLRTINKWLGIAAGLIEALLITWLVMYIADCFPASALGEFIISNAQADQILEYIYSNNLLETIIGI